MENFLEIYQSFLRILFPLYSNIYNSFEVINFANDNKIKIIYSATSSDLGNNGKDENLSPYSWAKSKNIELIKNTKGFAVNMKLFIFIMSMDQDKF